MSNQISDSRRAEELANAEARPLGHGVVGPEPAGALEISPIPTFLEYREMYEVTATCPETHGGYFGRGDTPAEAELDCRDACESAGDSWDQHGFRSLKNWRTGDRVDA